MQFLTGLHQPACRLKLRTVSTDLAKLGVIGLKCRATFQIAATDQRRPVPFDFVIDSGASYSLIHLKLAEQSNIAITDLGAEMSLSCTTVQGAAALRVRPGRVRVWWDQKLRGYPFDWPVLFRTDAPLAIPSILGLGGVVKTCRWTIDGRYDSASPYGTLVLEDTR